MTNPYEILGMTADSDATALRQKYDELRQLYSEQRFLEGEKGNEAARKLMELEDAWTLISADLQRKEAQRQFGGDYGEVDALIKSGKYDEAQSIMDGVKVRTAEWHYFQSIIYYKREWLTESRVQLAMAVSMDPGNKKYADALERLDAVMANPKADQQSFYNANQAAGAGNPYGRNNAGNDLCRCLQIYCCIECLCSMCCH